MAKRKKKENPYEEGFSRGVIKCKSCGDLIFSDKSQKEWFDALPMASDFKLHKCNKPSGQKTQNSLPIW